MSIIRLVHQAFMAVSRGSVSLVCLGLLLISCGCEQQAEKPQPVSTLSRGDDPPVTEVPPPAAEPKEPAPPAPAPAPVPMLQRPAVVVREKTGLPVETRNQRGIGFRIIFANEFNPDRLDLRVTLRDGSGNEIFVMPKPLGDYFLAEHYVPGAGRQFGPYRAQICFYHPEQDEWIPCTGWYDIDL